MEVNRESAYASTKGPLAVIGHPATSAPAAESDLPSLPTIHAQRPQRNGVQWLTLGISLLALIASLLDFGLIIGAVPIPVPGLRVAGTPAARDTASYGFEFDNDGWLTRGAATDPVSNNTHVFAGQGSLEFQVAGVSATRQAFAYTTLPAAAKAGARVVAHVYVPAGAPPLLATVYALDGSWAWHSGPFPSLNVGNWTAVAFQIPTDIQTPIRELGIMIIGTNGGAPYTGPMFLDSVDVQNP